MTTVGRETLVLTLPGDPALAHLAHLATLHFLRQNGVKAIAAGRSARTVERRARALLSRAPRATRGREAGLDLTLSCGASSLDVVLRRGTRRLKHRLAPLRRKSGS